MNLFGGAFHHVPLIEIVLEKKELSDSLLLFVSEEKISENYLEGVGVY
jgi:hypothetical protein